jgi:hypothetical protein
MRTKLAIATIATAALVVAATSVSLSAGAEASRSAPRSFFGMVPQTALTDTDAEYMRAGRIGSVRWPFTWSGIQPTANGGYLWTSIDEVVAAAARQRLSVLPFLYATPAWLAGKYTALPISNARQRSAWSAFVRAAVERYGPRGAFWSEHAPGSAEPLPRMPIRTWQIWNEANFFYFAFPVSPSRYARTLRLARQAVKSVDPGATVLLGGLFGEPDEGGRSGMDAADFLAALYRVPGIKADFDAVALHPYAVDAETLAEMVEDMREVLLDNRDPRSSMYITEMGWGSQNNFQQVAFEQGIRGQVRQLRDSYDFLLQNRNRLNLKGAYWFSWKDIQGSCSFCDSVGLFRRGEYFKPKPAWRAFVDLSGGRVRP